MQLEVDQRRLAMFDRGALYYPYIKFRDEQWLKSTLLVVPKVFRMIPDGYHPDDPDEVRQLEKDGLLDYANLNSRGVNRSLDRLLSNIRRDVEDDPRFAMRFSQEAANRLKRSTGDRFGYQLHSRKASQLLGELKDLELAWEPNVPDGDHYLEMHPHIGEGIMSTLAVACALDRGLGIVADEAPLCMIVLYATPRTSCTVSSSSVVDPTNRKPSTPIDPRSSCWCISGLTCRNSRQKTS